MTGEPNAGGGRDARLILFVTGDAPRSQRARANLSKAFGDLALSDDEMREIDLIQEPRKTVEFGIFATPALMRVDKDGNREVLYGDLSEDGAVQRFLSGFKAHART